MSILPSSYVNNNLFLCMQRVQNIIRVGYSKACVNYTKYPRFIAYVIIIVISLFMMRNGSKIVVFSAILLPLCSTN